MSCSYVKNFFKRLNKKKNFHDKDKPNKQFNKIESKILIDNNPNIDRKTYNDDLLKMKESNLKKKRESILFSKRKINNDTNKINLKNIPKNQIKNDNIDNIFKIGFNIKISNENLFDYVKNKRDIPLKSIIFIKVDSDGNCYYRCLSKFLYDTDQKHKELRNLIYEFCNSNKEIIAEFQPQVEIRNNTFINTLDYIQNISDDKFWATDIELSISSFIFGINIAVYKSKDTNNLQYLYSFMNDENNKIPLMVLWNENLNHFNIVKYKDGNNTFSNLNNKISNGLNAIKATKNIKLKRKVNPDYNDNLKDNCLKAKNSSNEIESEKENKKNQILNNNNINIEEVYDDANPYPKYTSGKDENLYLNIFNFLKDGINKGKRNWPKYIEAIKNKKIRENRKLDFYRKIGFFKPGKKKKLRTNNNIDINNLKTINKINIIKK